MANTTTKPRIILLIGLPGSGKSTWVKGKTGVLSSDSLRELLADDPDQQTINTRVFRILRYLLKQRLELRRPVTVVDATNLTPGVRRPYFKLAASFGAQVEAMFFDVPTDVCMARNRARGRMVPEDVILAMAYRLVAPHPAEGFAHVTVVR